MKILVCGGAGYIGGALTDILKHTVHDVIVYDSLVFEEDYLKPVKFVAGDIREHDKLRPLLDWADVVVWLAAIVGDGACAINPELSTELNQLSVKWLADNFDGRIIFMSTCSVYGAADGLLDENSPTNPLSVYASTKLAAEDYLKDKNAIIFRLGTIFGLGDEHSRIRLDLVVNTMTARAFHRGELKVFGGEQYRPLLHVRDVATAIDYNLITNATGIYNLHYGNMKMLDLGNLVAKATNAQIETVETTFEDSRNYKVSSDKARRELRFNPKLTVNDGISELLKLFSDGRIKDPNNPRYSNVNFLEGIYANRR